MKNIFVVIYIMLSLLVEAQDGNYVQTNGVKLYYEITGTGEPLVLLHGGTQTHEMWDRWLNDLSQNHAVITVDIRGHGLSTNPTDNYSFKEIAIDVIGLLDSLQIDSFHALGFSGGGMSLIHMATMESERMHSLTLFGAGHYFPDNSRDEMRGISYENISKNNPAWMEYMHNVHPRGESQIRSVLQWFKQAASSYDSDGMNFTAPHLSKIKCPTLIIMGDEDGFWSLDIPLALHEYIPNSNVWIIPNHGHSIPEYGTVLGDMFLHSITHFAAGNWNE